MSGLATSDDIRTAWARRTALHNDPETTAYRIFRGHTEGALFRFDRFSAGL